MDFKNTTHLDSNLLQQTFLAAVDGWPTERLVVRVRWSRGADFSGTCIYDTHRIYVNLGRHLSYPYKMETYCTRSRKAWGAYYKPSSHIELCDGYQVCLFVFVHEYYHWLIKQAGRNTAQKESMCDRFSARVLVDDYGCVVRDNRGRPLPRRAWDTQDLDRFVAAARLQPAQLRRVRPRPAARSTLPPSEGGQFLLFKS